VAFYEVFGGPLVAAADGKKKGNGKKRSSSKKEASLLKQDFGWVAGDWKRCRSTLVGINEGVIVSTTQRDCSNQNNFSVSSFEGSNRVFELNHESQLPCLLIGVPPEDCLNVTDAGPLGGTTITRAKYEGVGSYAQSQQDQIKFTSDHFEWQISNGTWIDSGATQEEDVGSLTCYKDSKKDGVMSCDLYEMEILEPVPLLGWGEQYEQIHAFYLVLDLKDCDFCDTEDGKA
jgi:hypothetical protein